VIIIQNTVFTLVVGTQGCQYCFFPPTFISVENLRDLETDMFL